MSDTEETVLVLGAGVIGLACAHYLTEAGFKVTVIDKGRIAGACSSSNCGHILPSHILPLNSPDAMRTAVASLFDRTSPFRVKPRLDPAFLYWMAQFARHCRTHHIAQAARALKALLDSSYAEYETLTTDSQFDCEWRKNGLLYLFKSQKSLDEFGSLDEALSRNYGVEASAISGKNLQSIEPAAKDDLAGGFLYTEDASLNPERLGRVWSDALKAKGVDFVEECTFLGLSKIGRRITVLQTSKGAFQAGHVVLAVGAMSREVSRHFGRRLPVEPGKGYAITASKPEDCPEMSIVIPEKSIAITPFEDTLRVGSMMEFVGFDDRIPDKRAEQLRDGANAYLRDRPITSSTERWFGWRPMTWDSVPIIGRLPDLDNAYAATGHQMIGVMTAPGTGKLMADIIANRRPHIAAAPFAPSRFFG
ncbi:MAG: FAD-dependent oxidoreductase [Pseudomonadota bacterium]